jgi:hypothetical protein
MFYAERPLVIRPGHLPRAASGPSAPDRQAREEADRQALCSLSFVMSIEHHFRQEQGHRRRVTAILGNVHDDVVTPTVTIPSAGTGSPTPDLAAPSTGWFATNGGSSAASAA